MSDYVCIAYLVYTSCNLLRMSIGYLEPLAELCFRRLSLLVSVSQINYLSSPSANK